MKRSYTEMHTYLKVMSKRMGITWQRGLELEEAHLDALENKYGKERLWVNNVVAHGSPEAEYNAGLIVTRIDPDVIRGKVKHIFMPDRAFCDWIVECVRDSDNSQQAKVVSDCIDDGIGVLHFPTGQGLRSVAFTIPSKGFYIDPSKQELMPYSDILMTFDMATYDPKSAVGQLGVGTYDTANPDLPLLVLEGSPLVWYGKLLVGLGMYLNAFPEVIKQGPPDDLKHPNHHDYPKVISVGIADRVRINMGTHASPIMHYRKGHYKFLKDPRYTKMQGKYVWWDATYVNKRNTITVLSPEDMKKKEEEEKYVSGRIDNDNNAAGDSVRQAVCAEGRIESGDQGTAEVPAAQRVHDPEEGTGTEG